MKCRRTTVILSSVLVLGIITSNGIGQSWAQSRTFGPSSSIEFIPPPKRERGEPVGQRGAGIGRDPGNDCKEVQLLALMPEQTVPVRTFADRPTWWFYVAPPRQSATSSCSLRFELVHLGQQQASQVYTQPFDLPDQPGLLPVHLPETNQGLSQQGRYRWRMRLLNQQQRKITAVYGDVTKQSQEASTIQKNDDNPDREQLWSYGQQGLWLELLNAVVEQHGKSPQTISEDWQSVLASVGLNCSALPNLSNAQVDWIAPVTCEERLKS